ncbi:MAG: heme-binding protein [Burkholderiales bacterium]|nr:heme-binding protein [Burkholderiales bacterium]
MTIAQRSIPAAHISLEAANVLIESARAAARDIGFEAAIAVTDAAGNLRAFERTDNCPFLTVDVAIDKAWTAASFGIATDMWADIILGNPKVAQLAHRPRLVAVGGGLPIVENGRVIGGIGISGGTADQDKQAGQVALKQIGFDVAS